VSQLAIQLVVIYALIGVVCFLAALYTLQQQFGVISGPGARARKQRLCLLFGVLWLPVVVFMVALWAAPQTWRTWVVHYIETGDWSS
jgi:hypothetical protein